MRFGTKLALFLILTLFGIQVASGSAIYRLIRGTLIDQGKMQLTAATGQFVRQLDEIERQMALGVQILTLDFALRQAIAQHDHETVLSALRNHGRRVGASRMQLVETDGTVSADTGVATDASPSAPRARFAYPALLERATDGGSVASVAVLDDAPVWLVIVPVLAPDPIAYVAAALPLNDALLAHLSGLAGLPQTTGLAIATPGGGWRVAAGPIGELLGRELSTSGPTLPSAPTLMGTGASETMFLATSLATTQGSPKVAAVMGYPLTDALRRYQRLLVVLLLGLAAGLAAAVLGASLIARGVARPIEALARYTKRIEAGDYTAPPVLQRGDEIGQLSAALGSMTRAIAEREEHIFYQSSHDLVTGLPNRQALMEKIDAGLKGRGDAALLVIALARLQEIANTVGHEIADRIKCDAAARLGAVLGNAPLGCVGDRSFAVFLAGHDAAGAHAVAQRVIETFEHPYREGDLAIDAATAIGVALAPAHGTQAALLLRRGEVALQAALRAEPRVVLYRAEIEPHRPELLSLMSDLRQGIGRNELELHYQPKLDLRTSSITGAEALVRWNHPTHGLIQPDAFIGLAEETGNIQHLTRWALQAGLAQAALLRRQGHVLRMSINLSVRDLTDSLLPRRIRELLAFHGLPADALVLEITESAIMGEPDAAIAVLRELADQGIALSIDDFGVGQSSLTYLRRLPVRELKIDKTFVQRLAQSQDDRMIVRTVIELGHNLDYAVTAEGAEDAAAIDLLRGFGCDYAQGYGIARPLPADAFERFILDRRRQDALTATS